VWSHQLRVRYGEEEKVPQAVIVPDPTPQLSSPAPLAAPPPLSGAGDDDMRPRLPTERWRRHGGEGRRAAHGVAPRPARAPAAQAAEAPAPESGSGATLIKSSPAVPVPRGVTDTATILPMPAPGQKRQVKNRHDACTAPAHAWHDAPIFTTRFSLFSYCISFRP
jgi:hypothetical protein